MKGSIQADHIPVNKYEILVAGLPGLIFTEISGLEQETENVVLPDRTTASGGDSQPVEFTAMQPMHHKAEVKVMEAWYTEGRDPVSPTYKKPVTLIHKSISGAVLATYFITGCWVSKMKLPDLEQANEGEMAQIEWTFKGDFVPPSV